MELHGLLAQLVERLVCTEEVRSSTLLESTIPAIDKKNIFLYDLPCNGNEKIYRRRIKNLLGRFDNSQECGVKSSSPLRFFVVLEK